MGTMYDPPHPGELVADCIEGEGWSVTEAAKRLGVTRVLVSRIIHGRTNVSPAMAMAFEAVGWSTAEHWLRMQASYDLAALRRQGRAA